MPEPEKFTAHLPAVLAATAATVLASLGTSFLGWAGTLAGVITASLVTGGGAWWAERWLRRSTARARALTEARRRKGRPLSPDETSYIAAITDEREKRRHRGIPWKLAGMSAAAVLAGTTAVIAFIELGTGKPVSAVVQGHPGHGLVVPVVQSPEPAASQATPSATLTPSQEPSPSSPAASVTPSPPATPAATTPPPSPSASPTAPPSVIAPSTIPASTPPASLPAISPS